MKQTGIQSLKHSQMLCSSSILQFPGTGRVQQLYWVKSLQPHRNEPQRTDLFGALQDLLRSCGSQDGPVAPWTQLHSHGQASHQLDPKLRDGHFVIHHCDGLLSQDCVRQRRQHLGYDREQSFVFIIGVTAAIFKQAVICVIFS